MSLDVSPDSSMDDHAGCPATELKAPSEINLFDTGSVELPDFNYLVNGEVSSFGSCRHRMTAPIENVDRVLGSRALVKMPRIAAELIVAPMKDQALFLDLAVCDHIGNAMGINYLTTKTLYSVSGAGRPSEIPAFVGAASIDHPPEGFNFGL